jgi:signal transduction histidine kinase
VDFVLCDEGEHVHLSVRNRGEPIPEALLAHLFEPFRRGAQSEARGGLGLGLFIAREVVLAHGGLLEAHSSPRYGTLLSVRLPRWTRGAPRSH